MNQPSHAGELLMTTKPIKGVPMNPAQEFIAALHFEHFNPKLSWAELEQKLLDGDDDLVVAPPFIGWPPAELWGLIESAYDICTYVFVNVQPSPSMSLH
jgi:hypothetical protein